MRQQQGISLPRDRTVDYQPQAPWNTNLHLSVVERAVKSAEYGADLAKTLESLVEAFVSLDFSIETVIALTLALATLDF